MKHQIVDRFARNVQRVRNLVAIYRQTAGPGSGRRGHEHTDVLRAAVVLLHAAMEDVLRSLAYWKLPHASSAKLGEIPFVGTRSPKFTLGELAQFRGKSVDDVILLSTNASLDQSNYNNVADVTNLLTSIGLDTSPLQQYMPVLLTTMKRRHKVVHRADENEQTGRGLYRVEGIAPNTVDMWITNTESFIRDLMTQV